MFPCGTYSDGSCVRYLAKCEERRERVKRQAREELLEGMPSQTRHGALLRQRVGKARPFSTTLEACRPSVRGKGGLDHGFDFLLVALALKPR